MADEDLNFPETVQLIDNHGAPDYFASEVADISLTAEVATLTFANWVHDGTDWKRVVVGRLFMPIEGAVALASDLSACLESNKTMPEGAAPQIGGLLNAIMAAQGRRSAAAAIPHCGNVGEPAEPADDAKAVKGFEVLNDAYYSLALH